MSSPDEIKWLGEHVLRKSRTAALRERMQAFVDEHGTRDLKALREGQSTDGAPMSEVVDTGRDERV